MLNIAGMGLSLNVYNYLKGMNQMTDNSRFKTKDNRVTRYAFACGYVEEKVIDSDNSITMSLEPNGFHLKGFKDGEYFWIILDNPVESIYPLKQAREFFDLFFVPLNAMMKQYIETIWFTYDIEDGYLKHSIDDLSDEALFEVKRDCLKFQWKARRIFNQFTDSKQFSLAGHDFWLTRNGHGAGFWDGDWPESIGKELTELSKSFGEVNPYTYKGKVYLS